MVGSAAPAVVVGVVAKHSQAVHKHCAKQLPHDRLLNQGQAQVEDGSLGLLTPLLQQQAYVQVVKEVVQGSNAAGLAISQVQVVVLSIRLGLQQVQQDMQPAQAIVGPQHLVANKCEQGGVEAVTKAKAVANRADSA